MNCQIKKKPVVSYEKKQKVKKVQVRRNNKKSLSNKKHHSGKLLAKIEINKNKSQKVFRKRIIGKSGKIFRTVAKK